jgi:hypothetical protein
MDLSSKKNRVRLCPKCRSIQTVKRNERKRCSICAYWPITWEDLANADNNHANKMVDILKGAKG